MARENFRGSNTEEGQFREIAIRDNSEQILKQNERYIEQLKNLRDAETQIQSTQIREAEAALTREANYDEKLRQEQIQASRTIADMQVRQLQAQAKEIQAITGRNANITGQNSTDVDDWIDFVTKYSDKAKTMFANAEQERANAKWDEGIAKAHLFGANFNTVAWNRQFANQNIMSMSTQGLAAAAAAAGADPAYVEEIRKGDAHFINATKHALAAKIGDEAAGKFKHALATDTETLVTITGPDGKQQKIPLNQIDPNNAAQIQEAYYQWLPDYYRKTGFGDASSEFLTDSLTRAKAGYDKLIGGVKQQELDRLKAERIDEAIQNFKNLRTPQSFVQAINLTYNLSDGSKTLREVRKEFVMMLADINAFPSQVEVDAMLDAPLGEGQKTLREQYGEEVREMEIERARNQQEVYTRKEEQKKALAAQKKLKWDEAIEKDRADGRVDISNEKIEELAAAERANGFPDVATHMETYKAQTADTIRTQQIEEDFQRRIDYGQILTPKEVLNSGLSFPLQQKWLALANESVQTAVPKTDQERIRRETRMVLGNNAKINLMAESSPNSLLYATDNAVLQWNQDFVTFMKKPGATPAAAHQYAREQFHRRLKDDPMYQLGDLTRDADGNISTEPYPYFIPKGSKPIGDFDAKMFNKYEVLVAEGKGREMFTEAHPELESTVRSAIDTVNNNGVFTMPPVFQRLSRMSGGKIPAIELFRLQANALGITDLPKAFQMAEDIQMEFPPEYQSFLNYTSNTTRTDIAMIGSGKEPIYAQMPPQFDEVKRIVMSRESPVEGYNAMNNGRGGDRPGGAVRHLGKEFKDMTLNEVIRAQQEGRLWAAGAYQFVPNTLPEAMKDAGITGDMKFTPEVQDAMFWAHFDKYGARKWEPYWSNPATNQELQIMENFRKNFDYKKPVWRQSQNMNPKLVYRMGNLGYGSTGPHLDVKPVKAGGVYGDSSKRYKEGELDEFVKVKGPDGTYVGLSEGLVTTSDDAAHRARGTGSFGHDYAPAGGGGDGMGIFLTNGARIVENYVDNSPEGQGSNRMVIELPNGKRYAFVHGTAAKGVKSNV